MFCDEREVDIDGELDRSVEQVLLCVKLTRQFRWAMLAIMGDVMGMCSERRVGRGMVEGVGYVDNE